MSWNNIIVETIRNEVTILIAYSEDTVLLKEEMNKSDQSFIKKFLQWIKDRIYDLKKIVSNLITKVKNIVKKLITKLYKLTIKNGIEIDNISIRCWKTIDIEKIEKLEEKYFNLMHDISDKYTSRLEIIDSNDKEKILKEIEEIYENCLKDINENIIDMDSIQIIPKYRKLYKEDVNKFFDFIRHSEHYINGSLEFKFKTVISFYNDSYADWCKISKTQLDHEFFEAVKLYKECGTYLEKTLNIFTDIKLELLEDAAKVVQAAAYRDNIA